MKIEKIMDKLKVATNTLRNNTLVNIDYGITFAEETALKVAKENAPVKTGSLKRSITAQKNGKNSFEVGSDLSYAAAVEYGTTKKAPAMFLAKALHAGAKAFISKLNNGGRA